MICCDQYKEWYHFVCIKLDPESKRDGDWVCSTCSNQYIYRVGISDCAESCVYSAFKGKQFANFLNHCILELCIRFGKIKNGKPGSQSLLG